MGMVILMNKSGSSYAKKASQGNTAPGLLVWVNINTIGHVYAGNTTSGEQRGRRVH